MAAKRSARRAESAPGALGAKDVVALASEAAAVRALAGPRSANARSVARGSRRLWKILARATRDDLGSRATRAAVLDALAAVAPFVGEAPVLVRLVTVAAAGPPELAPLVLDATLEPGPGNPPRTSRLRAELDAVALESARTVLQAFRRLAGEDAARALGLLAALLGRDEPDALWAVPLREAVAGFGQEPFRELASLVLGEELSLEGSSALLIEDRLTCAAGAFASSHEVLRALGQVVESEARSGDPHARRARLLVQAIGCAPPELAFPELDRLRLKVRHRLVRRAAEKALELVASVAGSSRLDLEDTSVPSFELDAEGARVFLEDGLELRLDAKGGVRWQPVAGSRRAKPSPELRRLKKALEGTIAAQRARLEQAMVDERSWTLASWRRSFPAHPILANLARRVLWLVVPAGTPVVLHENRLETLDGEPFEAPDDARISIAHPVALDPSTLEAARARWVERGLVQPWKQLFRETYTPLPPGFAAGIRARGECGRFRDHVVPHRNLYALARGRGWRGFACVAPGTFEGQRDFAQGVTAALDVGLATGADPWDPARGVRLGSLVFGKREARAFVPCELDRVPGIVFSEACRDLDLVVGVASVGEDEDFVAWSEARARGEDVGVAPVPERAEHVLGATAQVRAALLERVLPALGLGDRVRVSGRHALVHGELHDYRVHLGTGHAYVEPEGRFLVFPRRSREAAPDVYLPEEAATDPRALEVVSRILTLAADRLAPDPDLARQLEEP